MTVLQDLALQGSTIVLCLFVAVVEGVVFIDNVMDNGVRNYNRGPLVLRQRRLPDQIIKELGSYHSRYYQMDSSCFFFLVEMLIPQLKKMFYSKKRKRGSTPNGDIPESVRVSIAIRYFAGSDPLDIALTHGVSHSVVFESVWMVVDAVNQTKKLDIVFPACHEKQVRIFSLSLYEI